MAKMSTTQRICLIAIVLELLISTVRADEDKIIRDVNIEHGDGEGDVEIEFVEVEDTYIDKAGDEVDPFHSAERAVFLTTHCGRKVERVNDAPPKITPAVEGQAQEIVVSTTGTPTIPKEVSANNVQTFVEKNGQYLDEKSGKAADPIHETQSGIFFTTDSGKTINKVAISSQACTETKEQFLSGPLLTNWKKDIENEKQKKALAQEKVRLQQALLNKNKN